MKKLFLMSIMAISMSNTYANNDDLKLKTIKQIYADANKTNNHAISFKYSTPSFAKMLKRRDKVTQKDIDYGTGILCYESIPFLSHADFSLAKIQKTYSVDKKGRVVVKLKHYDNFNKKFNTETNIFVMQCTKNKCLIDDVFYEDDKEGSARTNIEESCPK